jgi:cytochrome c556
MSTLRKIIIASSCALLVSTPVAAQMSEKQASNAIEFRQSIFQLVKSNIGPLGAMAKGKAPIDEAVIAKNAMRMEQLSLMISDYFVADTRGSGVKTHALDKVWENTEDFAQKTKDFTLATQALQTIIENKDTANYRKGIGAVGATCKVVYH